MEKGLVQRVTALNRFIHDVYHEQEIIKAGIIPAEQILNNAQYRPEMVGVNVPNDIYSHIAGIDIVRAPDAQRQRRVLRARRQPARAQRRELHAGEPQDDDAALPRAVQRRTASRRSRTTPTCCSKPCAPRAPPATAEPDGGGAHARHVQQRLLRARLPRAADGRRAGRGAGPVRQGRLRLHAHHARPAARRRDLPPRRRRLPRPRGVPPDVHARLRRPDARLPRGQRRDLQCHRHRRGRRQVDLSLRAEDDRVLPRREADPEERADLHVPQQGGPRLRAGQPEGPGGQGGARRRRLRHADRPGRDAGRDRGLPQGRAGQARRLHRAADAEPVDLRRPSSRPASRRATSTCGPSCCRARRCRWCRAASRAWR